MNDSTTPTCNVSANERAIISATITNIAPKAADAGIRKRLSAPMNMRAMCGHTRPTNPMVPVKLTMAAVANDTMRRDAILILSESTPRDFALSSPEANMFSVLDRSIIATTAMAVVVTTTGMFCQLAYPRLPTPQLYTSFNASGLAWRRITVVIASKKYITAIPARIIVVGDV